MNTPAAAGGRAQHWDRTYEERGEHDVSWFQQEPTTSLELIDALGVPRDAAVLDVGGGASRLVDHLLARGYTDLTVLDVSHVALDLARARVGDEHVTWVATDLLRWEPQRSYALWHDRAVFHFLTDDTDRRAYLETLRRAVPDGAVIIATFAPDGPDTCSGLPVARYGPDELAALLEGFEVLDHRREVHHTPWDTAQPFTFVAARRVR